MPCRSAAAISMSLCLNCPALLSAERTAHRWMSLKFPCGNAYLFFVSWRCSSSIPGCHLPYSRQPFRRMNSLFLVCGRLVPIRFMAGAGGARSAWYGLSGVLYAIGGILVVVYPLGGALTLAVLIAIVLIAEGALRVVFGMVVRPLDGWGWLIFGGFGSIVVGVILLIGWPVTALWVTGLLLGINLIITGVINATLALASRTNTSALLTARGA